MAIAMPHGSSGRSLGAGLAVLGLLACSDSPLPGTMLGTYRVAGQLQTNSCGVSAPAPWTFDAQLSQNGSTLYWSWMDGKAPLSGPLTAQSASIRTSQQANVDGTVEAGLGPCTMQRDDDVEVTLGSGSPPSSFTGTITYAFSATSGSDCADQLTSSGGSYGTLPCTIQYNVTASRQ